MRSTAVALWASLVLSSLYLGHQGIKYMDHLANYDGDLEKEYYESLYKQYKDKFQGNDKFPTYLNETMENICVGHLDVASLSNEDYMRAFAAGPCAPTLIVPALTGTMLQVEIDCETFQEENPDVFSGCGWTRCDNSLFGSKPKSEYRLWVPPLESELSIVSVLGKSQYCFSELFQLRHTLGESTRDSFYNLPGTNVTWYGNTPDTYAKSQCGVRANEDVFDIPFVKIRLTIEWEMMANQLTYMGYIQGLTSQFLPYDFRYPLQYTDADYTFNRSLSLLNSLSSKKVLVIGHSFGVPTINYNLDLMTQDQKETMISSVIGLGGPLDGSTEVMEYLMGGSIASASFAGLSNGLTAQETGRVYLGIDSVWSMLPGNSYELYQDTQWMKNLETYIQYEQKYPPNSTEGQTFWSDPSNVADLDLSFLPNPLETCVPNTTDVTHCVTKITIPDFAFVTLEGKEYPPTQEGYDELFAEIYGPLAEQGEELANINLATNKSALNNPGVPYMMVFQATLPTVSSVTFDYNPLVKFQELKFAEPNETTNTFGDGTVPTFDANLAMYKWAYEFDNQEVDGAKPVKFVEMCSTYGENGTPYDSTPSEGEWTITENSYQGIGCDCVDGTAVFCDHITLCLDSHSVAFMSQALITNQVSKWADTLASTLTETQLDDLVSECPMIYADWSIQTVSGLIDSLN